MSAGGTVPWRGAPAARLIGPRRAVLYGGLLIASGHFSMAVPTLATFYLGLLLVVEAALRFQAFDEKTPLLEVPRSSSVAGQNTGGQLHDLAEERTGVGGTPGRAGVFARTGGTC